MSNGPATLTVFIPLTIRKRNGRPKIMPPAEMMPDYDDKGVDPHILRAIAKAWSWRRKLDTGQVATIQDIATSEDVTPVYVGRVLKLAYLAPAVLERLLIERRPPAVSIKDLATTAEQPWIEQETVVFG
jgi:CelD/BcsL family acetyltransferase involved in cellulose biosynthesis